jgi:hypothetical protein
VASDASPIFGRAFEFKPVRSDSTSEDEGLNRKARLSVTLSDIESNAAVAEVMFSIIPSLTLRMSMILCVVSGVEEARSEISCIDL